MAVHGQNSVQLQLIAVLDPTERIEVYFQQYLSYIVVVSFFF
jgi:hypothetical protein